MWLLPLLLLGTSVGLSVPVGRYLARVMDGRLRPPRGLAWVERRLDTGPQGWKAYAVAYVYHALNRAVGRATLFHKDGDYAAFEDTGGSGDIVIS